MVKCVAESCGELATGVPRLTFIALLAEPGVDIVLYYPMCSGCSVQLHATDLIDNALYEGMQRAFQEEGKLSPVRSNTKLTWLPLDHPDVILLEEVR